MKMIFSFQLRKMLAEPLDLYFLLWGRGGFWVGEDKANTPRKWEGKTQR